MTLRRLYRAAKFRIELSWNQTAHLMAAAFWSQGHRIDPDELNPLKQTTESDSAEPSSAELDAGATETVSASRIKVSS